MHHGLAVDLFRSNHTLCSRFSAHHIDDHEAVRAMSPDPIEIEYPSSHSVDHIKASLPHRLNCSISRLRLLFGGINYESLLSAGS